MVEAKKSHSGRTTGVAKLHEKTCMDGITARTILQMGTTWKKELV